jgi:hypothetical protein
MSTALCVLAALLGVATASADVAGLTYTGQLNESATSLSGTWTLASSVLNEKGTFEAKRQR